MIMALYKSFKTVKGLSYYRYCYYYNYSKGDVFTSEDIIVSPESSLRISLVFM